MPTENPTPPSIFAEIESALHALHIYGAAGLAAFGWAMGWLLETAARPWVPLWVCGGLLIDNADRLRRDPADAVNVPARTAASARYRTASRIALTLALVLGGEFVVLQDAEASVSTFMFPGFGGGGPAVGPPRPLRLGMPPRIARRPPGLPMNPPSVS